VSGIESIELINAREISGTYFAPDNINTTLCTCIIYLFISDIVDYYFLDEDKSIGLVSITR